MTSGKAASLDIVIFVVASALLAIIVRPWLERREQLRWPMVLATVTGYDQRPGVKGPFTWLRGRYTSGADVQEFGVVWGPSRLESGAWRAPADAPLIGSTISVHVDPRRPSRVALAEGPRVVSTPRTVATAAVVLILAVAFGITVWFV
jgi:hypothetical protein